MSSEASSSFLSNCAEPDQHGGVEDAEAAGRVAEEAEQGRQHEGDEQGGEVDRGLAGSNTYMASAPDREIDNADADLDEGQRRVRQRDLPVAAADHARARQQPEDIADDDRQSRRARWPD